MDQNSERSTGSVWLRGSLAGFLATIPMTLFMLLTQRFLPPGQHYELPPEIIIQELTHRARQKHHMNKPGILGVTLVSHFGYGAISGGFYALIEKPVPLSSPIKGMLFGLFAWAANYLGLLPLLNLGASGSKEPPPRNVMMIGAHIIWGLTLGFIRGTLQ
jgi:uncharacterized membrane protein YagU involved in acid resistance